MFTTYHPFQVFKYQRQLFQGWNVNRFVTSSTVLLLILQSLNKIHRNRLSLFNFLLNGGFFLLWISFLVKLSINHLIVVFSCSLSHQVRVVGRSGVRHAPKSTTLVTILSVSYQTMAFKQLEKTVNFIPSDLVHLA